MRPPRGHEAKDQIVERLCELVEIDKASYPPGATDGTEYDWVVRIGPLEFVIVYKTASRVGDLVKAIEILQPLVKAARSSVVPLVAVPFMSQPGRERCQDAGVSWIDLCGNAHVRSPGAFVGKAEGKRNRFREMGRPATAFAAKSSRVARCLLIEPERWFTQREIAGASGLSEGFTSRIVRRLEADRFVVRNDAGALRPRDPALLLDAWWEDYDLSKHDIVKGHVPARAGQELFRSMAKELEVCGVDYAATGFGPAWLLNEYAGFNTIAFYVKAFPKTDFLASIGFREGTPASNVWWVRPNDEGVYQGASRIQGIRCVHPVQVYLDLKGLPERSLEAADRLRQETLKWRKSGE